MHHLRESNLHVAFFARIRERFVCYMRVLASIDCNNDGASGDSLCTHLSEIDKYGSGFGVPGDWCTTFISKASKGEV